MAENPLVEKFKNHKQNLVTMRDHYPPGHLRTVMVTISDFIELLDFALDPVKLDPVKEVWVVRYSNVEPAEVDSIHVDYRSAEKRLDELNMFWTIEKWRVKNET